MDNARLNSRSYDEVVSSVVNYTRSIVELSDYEANMISDAMRMLSQPIPSTKLLISNSVDKLIKCKSDLAYIMLKINDYRRSVKIPHDDYYHKQFTLLTKQGRPSTESKVSEIYSGNEIMREHRNKLSDIDNLISFLESYINLIDSTIRNMESRKYDL